MKKDTKKNTSYDIEKALVQDIDYPTEKERRRNLYKQKKQKK